MWPYLPKKCNCSETPTNPGTVCTCELNSSQYAYYGEVFSCIDIQPGDSLTIIIQKLENYFCGIGYTQSLLNIIQENPQNFTELITLINDNIDCSVINDCIYTTTTTSTSSTTTTTTTISPTTTTTTTEEIKECIRYELTALVNNATWIAEDCSAETVGGTILIAGQTTNTPCIVNTSLVLDGCEITDTIDDCNTTTTTSTSTSTSTSTTSTTSTSTSTSTTTSTSTSSTTTTTTTESPTTTTTTTPTPSQQGLMNIVSNSTDACPISPLDVDCWITGSGDISLGDFVYLDSGLTTPFVGNGDFYHIQILIFPDSHSAQISNTGEIVGIVNMC